MSLYPPPPPIFPSFFMAGFESANHRKQGGERVDSIVSTRHDRHVREDYRRLADLGILAARDDVRWPLFEPERGRYEPEEILRTLVPAREAGVTVIWDLFHYGWPDDVDFWADDLVDRARAYAERIARILADEGDVNPLIAPVNEINYLSWAGGEQGMVNPFAKGRGADVKRQLARCSIAMCGAIQDVLPDARLVHTEPLVNFVADRPGDEAKAAEQREGVFGAWDIVTGRLQPELGGRPCYLDIVGVNYYSNNQLVVDGPNIGPDDPRFRPLSSILGDVWERYSRPIIVSETAEAGDQQASWLAHVTDECQKAMRLGVRIEGIAWYPILDYPDWSSGRTMAMGLWGFADEHGERPIHEPLRDELRRLQEAIEPKRRTQTM